MSVTSGIGHGRLTFVSLPDLYSLHLSDHITGDHLYEKLARATHDSDLFYQAYRVFTEALAKEQPEDLSRWMCEVEAWEEDPSKACPYDMPRNSKEEFFPPKPSN
jgi:hypothetical protein